MPPLVLKDVGIWISGLSFAGVSNSVSLEVSADTPDATVFGNEWMEYAEGGLKSSAFSLEGFYDSLDAAQFESLGEERSVIIVPAGQSPGDVAFIVPITVSGHALSGSVGELFAFAYAGEGDGPAVWAQVFDIRENETADNVTARVNLGPIATGETLDVWVHVTRRTGRVQIELESASTGTTTFITTRGCPRRASTARGCTSSRSLGPITDEWWQLKYDFNVGSPDFDFRSRSAR